MLSPESNSAPINGHMLRISFRVNKWGTILKQINKQKKQKTKKQKKQKQTKKQKKQKTKKKQVVSEIHIKYPSVLDSK